MKVKKTSIPSGSYTQNYLPCDYSDTFVVETTTEKKITPDDIMNGFWTIQPKWVEYLFRLRNLLVKPFGLTGTSNEEKDRSAFLEDIRSGKENPHTSVPFHSEQEAILCLDDKHLKAYLSIYTQPTESNREKFYIITVVHYHYWLGRAYFTVIRPFHRIIVRQSLRYVLRKLQE